MSGLYDLAGLAASLGETLAALRAEQLGEQPGAGSAPPAELAIPAHPEHGDLTTNAALVQRQAAGRAPRELAEELGERWLAGPGRRASASASRWPAPAFSTSSWRRTGTAAPCSACSTPAPTTAAASLPVAERRAR